MKTSSLAVVAISIMAASTTSASSARNRNAFSNAMQKSHQSRHLSKDQTPSIKTLVDAMTGDSKRAKNLRKKVMAKAKPLPKQRDLQSSNQASSSASSSTATTATVDGADDYFVAYGDWSNTFGFNPTQYSLSYQRCAAIRQFDEELASQEDSTTVFSTKNFAVFRFCPSKTCEGIPETYVPEEEGQQQEDEEVEVTPIFEKVQTAGANGAGCQSNYGEYMIELEDYLALMVRSGKRLFLFASSP
jgi:hypothetical protein